MSTKPKVIRRPGKGNGDAGKGVTPDSAGVAQEASLERESVKVSEPDPRSGVENHPVTQDTGVENTSPSAWPLIPGFSLEGVSLVQQYSLRSAVILADCAVQRTPEGVFDVLARNFSDHGQLSYWLNRIGKSHLSKYIKGKDIVDAARKVSHELYGELKREIGRPAARW